MKVGHVELLDYGVRGEVDHVDPDTFMTAVLSQPVQVIAIGPLADLREKVRQHREGSRPEINLEAMQLARHLQRLTHDALLVLYVPREQDEHVLNVGSRKVPDPVVPLDLVGLREINIHSRYDEGLSSHLSHCRDPRRKVSIYPGSLHLF